jgi:hypothetical protein
MMKEQKIVPTNQCLTVVAKPDWNDADFGPTPSPLTWNDPSEAFVLQPLRKDGGQNQTVSLRDVLESACDSQAIFFRKVSQKFPVSFNPWECKQTRLFA